MKANCQTKTDSQHEIVVGALRPRKKGQTHLSQTGQFFFSSQVARFQFQDNLQVYFSQVQPQKKRYLHQLPISSSFGERRRALTLNSPILLLIAQLSPRQGSAK
jgi:hypothetical protein